MLFALLSTAALASITVAAPASSPPDEFGNVPNPATYPRPTYITPSSANWPSKSQFAAAGAVPVRPWAAVCYPGAESNATACSAVQAGYTNGFQRSNQQGSLQLLNWEECAGQSCLLNTFAPQQPQVGTCYQGRIPPYSVTVNTPLDAIKAIDFAVLNRIKIVIKNTGHEYLGRSSGKDGLQIWTHKLKTMTHYPQFQADGCKDPSADAITIGSGSQAGQVYEFVASIGRVVTLGAVGSVGVGGGFSMGGGHGPLGPQYGMAVDNILQYSIVVNSGSGAQLVKANACTNPTLFSALRGGGGGVYGVVTDVTYKIHPDVGYAVVNIDVTPATNLANLLTPDEILTEYFAKMASYSLGWKNAGWAGYFFLTGTNASFSYGISRNDSHSFDDMKDWVAYLSTNPNLKVTAKSQTLFPKFQNFVTDFLIPAGDPNAPVAYAETLASRLLPSSLFTTAAGQLSVAQALVKTQRLVAPTVSAQAVTAAVKPIALQIYSTGAPLRAVPDCKNGGSCIHPAWSSNVYHVVAAQAWTQNFPQYLKDSFAIQTNKAVQPLRDLSPGGGAYYSEVSTLEDAWQSTFFGSNYAQLLAVKVQFDPLNVFNVWKGVGWTGAVDPAYKCYATN